MLEQPPQGRGHALGGLRNTGEAVSRVDERLPPVRTIRDQERQSTGQIVERLVRCPDHGPFVGIVGLRGHQCQPDVAGRRQPEQDRAGHRPDDVHTAGHAQPLRRRLNLLQMRTAGRVVADDRERHRRRQTAPAPRRSPPAGARDDRALIQHPQRANGGGRPLDRNLARERRVPHHRHVPAARPCREQRRTAAAGNDDDLGPSRQPCPAERDDTGHRGAARRWSVVLVIDDRRARQQSQHQGRRRRERIRGIDPVRPEPQRLAQRPEGESQVVTLLPPAGPCRRHEMHRNARMSRERQGLAENRRAQQPHLRAGVGQQEGRVLDGRIRGRVRVLHPEHADDGRVAGHGRRTLGHAAYRDSATGARSSSST